MVSFMYAEVQKHETRRITTFCNLRDCTLRVVTYILIFLGKFEGYAWLNGKMLQGCCK